VVASPLEIAAIRDACGAGFVILTPGIRPAGSDAGDQRRTMTPREAIAAGADYLVVGRPITGAADPRSAALSIVEEMG
jgi:orotidine-5'-phosphate decarboxylase